MYKNNKIPKQRRTKGQIAADKATSFFGSWSFLVVLILFLGIWIVINSIMLMNGGTFDPYPFILLNFIVSLLTVFQAAIILMSQNRQTERDRQTARYDYQINRKAEREISEMQKELNNISKSLIRKKKK